MNQPASGGTSPPEETREAFRINVVEHAGMVEAQFTKTGDMRRPLVLATIHHTLAEDPRVFEAFKTMVQAAAHSMLAGVVGEEKASAAHYNEEHHEH